MKPDLLLQNADFVQCLAHSLVTNASHAEDVMQETWMAALNQDPAESYLKPWLATVVKNISIKFLRSEKRRSKHEREAAVTLASAKKGGLSASENYDRKVIRSRLMKAVMELKQPYQQAIMLRYFDNLPPREIAKYLEMPVERVKAHLKRGLAQLRFKLDQNFNGDRKRWVLAILPFAGLTSMGEADAAVLTSRLSVESAAPAPLIKVMVAVSALLCLTIPLFSFFSTILSDPNENAGDPLVMASRWEDQDAMEAVRPGLDSKKEVERIAPLHPRVELTGRIITRAEEKGIENASVQVTLLSTAGGRVSFAETTAATGAFSVSIPVKTSAEISALQFTISCPGFRDMEKVIPFAARTGQHDCGRFFID